MIHMDVLKDINMSNRGLYIPLSVIQGDTLDLSFDISRYGDLVLPENIKLEGFFDKENSLTPINTFSFYVDADNLSHAVIGSDLTESLSCGEYTYQIRFYNLPDDKINTTIMYGSLQVLPSHMPYRML